MNLTKRTELRRLPSRGSHDSTPLTQFWTRAFSLTSDSVSMASRMSFRLFMAGMEKDFICMAQPPVACSGTRNRHPGCVTVTLVDGLVLARSAFHHSMNYRSVVAFGTAHKIDEPAQKTRALRIISEHLIAGRWNDVRAQRKGVEGNRGAEVLH